MTFLPIVARELRVAARRKETYSTRLGVGLGALLLGGICALTAATTPVVRFGNLFLETLGGVAMLYCLLAGRFLTADSLSREKREETLGLLFLTDLKGYDVVLGKMAATSLNGLYGLLVVVPMLAMALLTGGTTLGEILRVALALVLTFLFSLAIGIFASALAREFRSAIGWNFLVLLVLAGGLPLLLAILLGLFSAGPLGNDFLIPCPVYTFVQAFTVKYSAQASEYWSSAAFVFFMALLLVALASQIVPHSWQATPETQVQKEKRQRDSFDPASSSFRRRLLDLNPYCWRSARPRKKVDTISTVMVAVAIAALFWLLILRSFASGVDDVVFLTVVLMLHTTLKLWITLEAARSFADDVNSGAFELLLPTPLTTEKIVRGQSAALRYLFTVPVMVVVSFETLLVAALMSNDRRDLGFYLCIWLAGLAMMAADVVALSLMSMSAALTEKNITRATLKTAITLLLLPWLLWAGAMAIEAAWYYLHSTNMPADWGFDLACWLAIGLGLDWIYGRAAWRRLSGSFRQLVLKRFEPPPPKATLRARCAQMQRFIRENIWRHPRHRKWAIALATLSVIGFSIEVWDIFRSHLPPPEVVLIGPSHRTTLQAVRADNGVFLVLPDGSLWQWGQIGGTNCFARPVRITPFRDWKTISVNGDRHLGIRQDGTLWEWRLDGDPIQIGHDHDWAEATAHSNYAVARKTDGSLWEWGEISFSRIGVSLPVIPFSTAPGWSPAPPPTDHHWKAQTQISIRSGAFGLRAGRSGGSNSIAAGGLASRILTVDGDGTLWVQGLVSVRCATGAGLTYTVTTNYPAPIQVCCETNWVGFDRAGNPLDERGEVWTVFAAPPNPAASIQATGNPLRSGVPAPLGTNHDWTALDSTEDIFLATRSDGSLWGWGRLPNPGIGPPYYHGTQICLETNWIGFTRLFGRLMARNSDGEIWLPTGGSSSTAFPSPATSMSALGVLFASGVSSNQQSQLAPSFAPNLIRYEIHTNGTLWTVPYKFNLASVFTKADQADPRTNWVAVTTAGITTFGLTADGTLWTWGMDLSEKPQAGLRSRLAARFPQFSTGTSPALSGIPSRVDGYPYRPKPRPLMKLQPAQ